MSCLPCCGSRQGRNPARSGEGPPAPLTAMPQSHQRSHHRCAALEQIVSCAHTRASSARQLLMTRSHLMWCVLPGQPLCRLPGLGTTSGAVLHMLRRTCGCSWQHGGSFRGYLDVRDVWLCGGEDRAAHLHEVGQQAQQGPLQLPGRRPLVARGLPHLRSARSARQGGGAAAQPTSQQESGRVGRVASSAGRQLAVAGPVRVRTLSQQPQRLLACAGLPSR